MVTLLYINVINAFTIFLFSEEFKKTVPVKLGVRLQEVVQRSFYDINLTFCICDSNKNAPQNILLYPLCFAFSPEELSLALRKNSRPFLLGVKNGAWRLNLLGRVTTQTRCDCILFLSSSGCVCVCLGSTASVQDEIRAMCQAAWISGVLTDGKPVTQPHGEPLTSTFVNLLIHAHKKGEGLMLFSATLCFCFVLKGHWEIVHESHRLMDTNFNAFLRGEHTHTHLLKPQSIKWCVFHQEELIFATVCRSGGGRMGHEADSDGLGRVEGGLENKTQLTCRVQTFYTICLSFDKV